MEAEEAGEVICVFKYLYNRRLGPTRTESSILFTVQYPTVEAQLPGCRHLYLS
jgi:hypothetical protein